MKRYYYFCHACGGDTATYERVNVCPYCHAHSPRFALIDEDEAEEKVAGFTAYIQSLRQRWDKENPKKQRGETHWRKKRLFQSHKV